jgi:integrase
MLVGKPKREILMKGSIYTEQKCPFVLRDEKGNVIGKCNKPFVYVHPLGFYCPEHQTVPTRYLIDVYWTPIPGKGEGQVRIYSDKSGMPIDSFHRAQIAQEEISREIIAGKFDPTAWKKSRKKDFYCSVLLDRFLEVKISAIAVSYVHNYRAYVRVHKDYWGDFDVREIRKNHVNSEYLYHLEKMWSGPKHMATRALYFYNFRVFLNWCEERGLIDHVPRFIKIDVPDPELAVLSENQLKDVIHVYCPVDDRPFLAFLILTPVRPGEARAIKLQQVDLESGNILIDHHFSREELKPKRKGQKSESYCVAIHPEIADWIVWRKSEGSDEDWLLPRPYDGDHYTQDDLTYLWEKIRAAMGLDKKIRMYDATRHSAATLMARKGADIFDIQAALGHTTPKMAKRYVAIAMPGTKKINVLSLKRNEEAAAGDYSGNTAVGRKRHRKK